MRVRGPNSVANGSNIVALRFGDHGTKEILEVVDRFQQLPTTRNNIQQGVQTDAFVTFNKCWGLLANKVASFCSGLKGL